MTNGRTPRRLRRPVVLTALAAVVVVAILALAGTSSSAVCSSCHAMRPYAQGLYDSKHTGTACYSCHLDGGVYAWPGFKVREILVMYPKALLGGKVSGPGTRVARNSCTPCHQDVLAEPVISRGYRIVHSTCTADTECSSCHSGTAHGKATRWVRQPVMDDCVRCHLDQSVMADCDACHAAKGELERLAAGPWQVTHGPNWRQTHGMGDIELCRTCHPADYCEPCHSTPLPHASDFGSKHGGAAQAKDAKCDGCHDRDDFCTRCHGLEMPHASSYLAKHSREATGLSDPRCMRCHYEGDCESCHVRHTHPGSTQGTYGGAPLPEVDE